MTTLMMILMLGQETPGEALKKFAESVEKKDFNSFMQVCTEKMKEKMKKEDFEDAIQKTEEKTAGHFIEAMKKGPSLGAVGEGAARIEIRWLCLVLGGQVQIRVKMVKTETGWRISDFNPHLEKTPTKGIPGKAASSPAQVVQALVAAIEKKEYDKVQEFLFEPKDARPSEMGEKIAEEEKKNEGHWLEGLKRAAIVEGGDEALTEIDFSMDLDVTGGKVEVELKYVKGKTDWKLRDIDSDFKKAK